MFDWEDRRLWGNMKIIFKYLKRYIGTQLSKVAPKKSLFYKEVTFSYIFFQYNEQPFMGAEKLKENLCSFFHTTASGAIGILSIVQIIL